MNDMDSEEADGESYFMRLLVPSVRLLVLLLLLVMLWLLLPANMTDMQEVVAIWHDLSLAAVRSTRFPPQLTE